MPINGITYRTVRQINGSWTLRDPDGITVAEWIAIADDLRKHEVPSDAVLEIVTPSLDPGSYGDSDPATVRLSHQRLVR